MHGNYPVLGAPTQPHTHTHRSLAGFDIQGSDRRCSQLAQQISIAAPDRCVPLRAVHLPYHHIHTHTLSLSLSLAHNMQPAWAAALPKVHTYATRGAALLQLRAPQSEHPYTNAQAVRDITDEPMQMPMPVILRLITLPPSDSFKAHSTHSTSPQATETQCPPSAAAPLPQGHASARRGRSSTLLVYTWTWKGLDGKHLDSPLHRGSDSVEDQGTRIYKTPPTCRVTYACPAHGHTRISLINSTGVGGGRRSQSLTHNPLA